MRRRPPAYTPEAIDRAVKMVADARSSFRSERDAVEAVAGILGIDDPEVLSKWVRSARAEAGSFNSGKQRRSWKTLIFRSHTILAGVVITVAGGLVLAYSQQLFGVGQPSVRPPGTHLEVEQISFSYGKWTGQNPDPFKIDVRLLNSGRQLAAVNEARLVIQGSVVLRQCAKGGEDFPPTGLYQAKLPTHPSVGHVIHIPVSQLVPADGADRFDLLLRARLPQKSPTNVPVYLYHIHLYLAYNADNQVLDAGEMIVAFPFAPVDGQYLWTRGWAANPSRFDSMMNDDKSTEARAKACDIANSQKLRTFFSSVPPTAKRPGNLAGIESRLAY